MIKNVKHLYVHIPFCKAICTYCNFKKIIYNKSTAEEYINKIVDEINDMGSHKFSTIYIGGGTPNCLPDELLIRLLSAFNNKLRKDTEFTIELNPEFVTDNQIHILEQYGVNRLSIGIQILNDEILRIINRVHDNKQINKAMEIINKSNIKNVSCDFIYNLPKMKHKDIDNIIQFINKWNIKHVSYYSLELKEDSIMDKLHYVIDEEQEEKFMDYVHEQLELKTRLKRYEISNWAISEDYQSKHNIAYWQVDEWIGIGWGASGYINHSYIENIGDSNSWLGLITKESIAEYYKTIIMMGLRMINGLDLRVEKNKKAFEFFKSKLNSNLYVIENNYLKVKNINLLHNLLIEIF